MQIKALSVSFIMNNGKLTGQPLLQVMIFLTAVNIREPL